MLVPQVRDGSFSTELLARYQRSEQALVLTLMEMVVNGVSTRNVTQITAELCGTSFAKSTVSALCAQLDPLVTAWNERPLGEQAFPFVLVDALLLKVREDERVRAEAGLLAIGVSAHQLVQLPGVAQTPRAVGPGPGGVRRPWRPRQGHPASLSARQCQGASWQRCQTHLTRDVREAAPKAVRAELHAHVQAVLAAPDPATARTLLQQLVETYADLCPTGRRHPGGGLRRRHDDATAVLAVLALPEPYRRRLRTTTSVERLNEEIRRRERVIRTFPTRASALRLLGAVLMEQHEQWTTGHRYLDMDAYWQ